jgi:hypothetical protein
VDKQDGNNEAVTDESRLLPTAIPAAFNENLYISTRSVHNGESSERPPSALGNVSGDDSPLEGEEFAKTKATVETQQAAAASISSNNGVSASAGEETTKPSSATNAAPTSIGTFILFLLSFF